MSVKEYRKVTCPICGKKFRVLHPNGHLKVHGITTLEEFYRRFPEEMTSYTAYSYSQIRPKSIEGFDLRGLKISATKRGITLHRALQLKKKEKEFKKYAEEGEELVTCKICGGRFKRLAAHLHYKHGITTKEYLDLFKGGLTCSKKSGRKTAETCNAKGILQKARENAKIGLLKKYGVDNPMKVPEIVLKQFKSSVRHVKSKPEILLETLLDSNFTGQFVYNGCGNADIMIGHRIPDFIHTSKKKVIEVFGVYWHGERRTGIPNDVHEKERIEEYRKEGYDCLVIWENELDDVNKVCKKIESFLKDEGSETEASKGDLISGTRHPIVKVG